MTRIKSSKVNLACSLSALVSSSRLLPVAGGGSGTKGWCVPGHTGSVMIPDQCLLKLSAVAMEVVFPFSRNELRHGLSGRARPAKFAHIRFSLARQRRFCRRTSKIHLCTTSRSSRASSGKAVGNEALLILVQRRTAVAPAMGRAYPACARNILFYGLHTVPSIDIEEIRKLALRSWLPPRPFSSDKRSRRLALLSSRRFSWTAGYAKTWWISRALYGLRIRRCGGLC